MKNKVLYTEVLNAAEHLATVLRNYTDEPMYLNLCIFTRDADCHHEGAPDGVPDYYDVVAEGAEHVYDDAEPTIATSARVYYSEDQYGELIRTVIPYREQVAEDDEQG